ncbi:MAG: glycosyltransferase [Lachnospiraceae bacterium]
MISIILPAYNAEEFIGRAIESVLKQTYKDFELIVIDDGSDDDTAGIVSFYVRQDSRIRLLRIPHQGVSAARNAGLRAAQGEWITFLDADDEFVPQTCKTVLSRLRGREAGLVIFSIEYVRAYIYLWPPQPTVLRDHYYPGNGERCERFIAAYYKRRKMLIHSQCNKFYKRAVIEKHKLAFREDLQYGEDQLFNYSYLEYAGSVMTLAAPLLKYNMRGQHTLSTSHMSDSMHLHLYLSEQKMNLFRSYGYAEEQLVSFKIHDACTIIDKELQQLMLSDQQLGSQGTRAHIRKLFESRCPSYFFSKEVLLSKKRRQAETDRVGEIQRLGLASASDREHKKYFYLSDYELFLDQVNVERTRNLLRDKGILLRRLAASDTSDFLGRRWLDLRRCSLAEFEEFVNQTDRFVAKMFNGHWSRGFEIVDTSALGKTSGETSDETSGETLSETSDETLGTDYAAAVCALYRRLLKHHQYIVEEYILQHTELQELYRTAVTTLRIFTLCVGDTAETVFIPSINVGSRGATTNNEGSIQAFYDTASGCITTDGTHTLLSSKEKEFVILEVHPDTNIRFKGFHIPYTAEAAEMAMAAAKLLPEIPFIGWDIALTQDGPLIVEGNAAPMLLYSWQMMYRTLCGQHGMRKDFEALLTKYKQQLRKSKKKAGLYEL